MKFKSLLSVLFVFMFVMSLNSQTLFIDNFDYPAGDSIGAHGWQAFSGNTNTIFVTSPGLTYTGYPNSGIGNACKVNNTGIDNYKSLSSTVTTGSVYASFMLKVDSAKTGDYFFTMLPSTSTTVFLPRVFVKDSAGTMSFGVSKGPNAATPTYGANGFAYGTTYLIVVKYTFNAGTTTDDEIKLYVFTSPTLPATEPSTPYIGPFTSGTTDALEIARVVLRQGTASSAPTLTIDGIKVSTSWANILVDVKTVSTVASDFKLNQNYPNPFNPSTKISFAIPQNGIVTLKVYNILGNEVETLVNSNLTIGNYEVNFNAANIASGTYFYKMNFMSNDGKTFSDTKKLMLMK